MRVQVRDFNGADALLTRDLHRQWEALCHVLEELPLHVKASEQTGKEGTLIFDRAGAGRMRSECLDARDESCRRDDFASTDYE